MLLIAVIAQCGFAVRLLLGAIHASRADAALLSRDFENAAEVYARAERYVPFRGDWAYAHAGAVRDSQGDTAAMPMYERALALAPYSEPTMVASAESLIDLGRRDEAVGLLDRALAVTPFDWKVHYLYGVVATIDGRAMDAVAALRTAADLVPGSNATILNPLANALLANGKPAEAALQAQRAITIQPLSPEHHLVLGKALVAQGKSADARPAFEYSAVAYRARLANGEAVAGPLAESEEGLAFTLLDTGRPDEAADSLLRISAISAPAAARAAQRLAPWLSQSGPHAPLVLWKFAIDALVEGGSIELTEDVLERAIASHPDFAAVFLPADARVSLARGRPDEAMGLLKNAPESAKSGPDYQLALALTHAALGNSATAALEFDALLNRRDLPPGVRRQAVEASAGLP